MEGKSILNPGDATPLKIVGMAAILGGLGPAGLAIAAGLAMGIAGVTTIAGHPPKIVKKLLGES